MSPFGPWPEQWYLMSQIGPLQLAIHEVQNRRAGEKTSHWEKANKENYHFKLCMSFVCLVPVRLLLSSVAVLSHVNGLNEPLAAKDLLIL